MRIILTHEQADFDALASLLGARLLDEGALAVLPRRMNRNVRAFLTLYGVDLPFVDPRDLPNEPVDQVILVDTQSAVSVKGMHGGTSFRVIDHHPLRENLPPGWDVTTENLGATTTLLIEALRETNGRLTQIQATLLLLGIYEDTGSLTYTRTTPRDLRAAAFLLEAGANLQIANNFLNHPLSQAQQVLYDSLRSEAEYFNIHGHSVLVSCGDAQEMDEEISTIVHKLRDLLDPDALFVLIRTKGGIQIIARSTSDHIDVAEIVAKFGGGGHERAAAALLRGGELDDVRRELIDLLPEHVRPAITVAQIMSRGPQLLPADTPVDVALDRMQRYGYEGYPVVGRKSAVDKQPGEPRRSEERVIGLLTRRAVDRAIMHKLNLPVSSLMEAGEVTIEPEASVEELQRLMTETGWGQIPVVQPESGAVIGIVTRTDLLKTLAPASNHLGTSNLAGRLENTLPPARLALLKAISQTAYTMRCALYIVGGFVRDLLLDRPSLDFDLVVEGDAIALARALAGQYGGRITCHTRFGTAKWHIEDLRPSLVSRLLVGAAHPSGGGDLPPALDLITARTEFYTYPTALPTVERGSIKLDLHRRDFTINTLALRLDGRHYGELYDYWGGLNDLHHGLVRALHSLSFVDDPTRMLRAVRFEQRFDFSIEQRTLELMKEAYDLLERVSGDRVRHELNHILDEPRVTQILNRLNTLGLLEKIHPNLKWDAWLETRLESLPYKTPDAAWELVDNDGCLSLRRELAYVIWLLRLPEPAAMAVCIRLMMPASLKETIREACRLWNDLPSLIDARPSAAVQRLEGVPALARYAVYLATSDLHLRKILQTYATRWKTIQPTVDGYELMRRGLNPGPQYKAILWGLRKAWLDGEIKDQAGEARLMEALLEESLQEQDDSEKASRP